jgi:predicted DCC family thiol-disulfide oxidoreductase YuxK
MLRAPTHSYRSDPGVPSFDDAAPLVIFDGHCVLCSEGVQWMLARDPQGQCRFTAIQNPLAQGLYAHYGLDAEAFDTFMVLSDGIPHTRWAGMLAAARTMPAPWRWLGRAGQLVPAFLGDRFYNLVQRNRLRWFGTRDTCLMPSSGQRRRFVL